MTAPFVLGVEPEWQAAIEALILVAENGGPTMLARIGVMRAFNRHVEQVVNVERKAIIGASATARVINGSERPEIRLPFHPKDRTCP